MTTKEQPAPPLPIQNDLRDKAEEAKKAIKAMREESLSEAPNTARLSDARFSRGIHAFASLRTLTNSDKLNIKELREVIALFDVPKSVDDVESARISLIEIYDVIDKTLEHWFPADKGKIEQWGCTEYILATEDLAVAYLLSRENEPNYAKSTPSHHGTQLIHSLVRAMLLSSHAEQLSIIDQNLIRMQCEQNKKANRIALAAALIALASFLTSLAPYIIPLLTSLQTS